MPALDIYHDAVKNALIKDGWTITHDPFTITYEKHTLAVDLGAERNGEPIAVEVKRIRSSDEIQDFVIALGQYIVFRSILTRVEPERKLMLAVPLRLYNTFFQEPIARPVLEKQNIHIFAFDPEKDVIVQRSM